MVPLTAMLPPEATALQMENSREDLSAGPEDPQDPPLPPGDCLKKFLEGRVLCLDYAEMVYKIADVIW